MKKAKQRKQYLSILLIPDDYSDPFSFKVRIKTIKILATVIAILVIHVFSGAIYYFKYYQTERERQALEIKNYNLIEENKQVKSLYDEVAEMRQFFTKFRSALGVDKGFEVSGKRHANFFKEIRRNANFLPRAYSGEALLSNEAQLQESKLDFFLTRSKSNYHKFAKYIPTYLPVEGFLSTDFRKNDWFLPDHNGIDIATSRGTRVGAAADGIVVFANWTDDLGNMIIINHLNGFMTLYGHNQVLLKKEGNYVKKGETIALLGNSGRSTAPHLHYEVWKDGIAVDPKKYLLTFQSKNDEEKF